MPIELYPNIAKVKRNGVYQNLPGFAQASSDTDIEAMIANSETSTTAQYPHPQYSFFILNDVFYQATENIAVNDIIAVGTNCIVSNIANILYINEKNINNIEESIGLTLEETSILLPSPTPQYYWNLENSVAVKTVIAGTNWMAYNAIDVNEGDKYKVKACQGNTNKTRIWAITDENLNIITMANNHYGLTYAEEEFTVPSNGKKLLITTTSSVGGTSPYAYLTKLTVEADKIIKNIEITDFTFEPYTGWLIDSGYAVKTELAGSCWCASSIIKVKPGEQYTAIGTQGSSHKVRIWALVNDEMEVILIPDDSYGYQEITSSFIVPENATMLLLTGRSDSNYVKLTQNNVTPFDYVDYKINNIEKTLAGKKLSLLGDSISAYAGTIPQGNTPYYNGNNSGVSSPEQMWWNILCKETGMTPLVINGWSGSGINWQTDSSHSSITPMSDDSRCNNLGDDDITPDVIIIAGGINDYTYAEQEQNEPLDWNGIDVPQYTEPSAGKKVYASFTEAYVAMIKKLQTNYPKAIIVALSTWFSMRGTDNGYILTHTVGQNVYTQQNYNDKIKYVAEQMHIPYIDVSNIGFNRNNFYPTYAVDSSTIPTHPNARGHEVMGKAIAEKLKALLGGIE